MKDNKDIHDYKNHDYDVIMKQKKGLFYFIIPDLPVIAQGETLESAYQELEKEKELFFKKAIECDSLHLIKTDRSKKQKKEKSFFDEISVFLTKLAVLGVVLLVVVYFAFGKIADFASQKINRLVTENLSQVSTELLGSVMDKGMVQLNGSISTFAASGGRFAKTGVYNHLNKVSNASDEEIEVHRDQIRRYVDKIKPLYDEVSILWDDEKP
ncbi:type II toxin-antitoxin system HicB family antitoxin [Candidatus Latescibacterota bacterium]